MSAPRVVLDLGCGAGNVTAFLAQRWPDARIVGVDNSQEMLAKARASTVGEPRREWIDADIASYAARCARSMWSTATRRCIGSPTISGSFRESSNGWRRAASRGADAESARGTVARRDRGRRRDAKVDRSRWCGAPADAGVEYNRLLPAFYRHTRIRSMHGRPSICMCCRHRATASILSLPGSWARR
jgi:SAM-dependent methyltransferase